MKRRKSKKKKSSLAAAVAAAAAISATYEPRLKSRRFQLIRTRKSLSLIKSEEGFGVTRVYLTVKVPFHPADFRVRLFAAVLPITGERL